MAVCAFCKAVSLSKLIDAVVPTGRIDIVVSPQCACARVVVVTLCVRFSLCLSVRTHRIPYARFCRVAFR
jgi:hypothetical protein